MGKMTLKIGAFTACLTVAAMVNAQDVKPINVVTTAVPFLRISPDARAGGMGEVGMATAPDANSGFYNLAKTPFNTSKMGIGLTYTPWLKRLGLNDVYMVTLGGYYKLDEMQALSTHVRYFSLGNIQFTDEQGNEFGSARPREVAFDLGYSRKLSQKTGLGLALRYINSNLAGGQVVGGTTYKAGSAVAADLSFYYNGQNAIGNGWSFGAAMTNLGSKIGYTSDATQKDYIPANLAIGAAYSKVFNESNKITFGLDLNKLMVPTPPFDPNQPATPQEIADYRDKGVVGSWFSSFGDAPGGFGEELREFQVGGGIEYTYAEQFSLRGGYFYEDKTKGNRKYFTLGAGLKYNVFNLNVSYIIPSGSGVNQNPLSNTLRFGIIFDINGGGNATN
jgi:hypothetical protein